jgi:hypothetical protein
VLFLWHVDPASCRSVRTFINAATRDLAALETELPQSCLGVLLLAWVEQVGWQQTAPCLGWLSSYAGIAGDLECLNGIVRAPLAWVFKFVSSHPEGWLCWFES